MAFASLFVILILIAAMYFMYQRNRNGLRMKKQYLPSKKLIWVLCGYVAVLLISTAVYLLIPTMQSTQDHSRPSDTIYNKIMSGDYSSIDPKLIALKQEKDYSKKELRIGLGHFVFDDSESESVFIERKATNDGKIEAYLYQPTYIINGVDVTRKLPSLQLEWSDGTLIIIQPEKVKLKFALPAKELIGSQFSGDGDLGHDTYMVSQDQTLFLRIPKDLKVINKVKGAIQIEYVER